MTPPAGGCPPHAGGVLLLAAAALGYWVLRSAEKDGGYVRWAGRVVGWALIVFGLAGFLCGAVNHARHRCGQDGAALKKCHETSAPELPPGHPPIDGVDKKVR